ncbi:coiled-coil domain-containing protein 149 [Acyrthosiphon pisum]|uniref:Coiled-coil domain-containing protein 149 n=1 Tax=Acyrthosiphon pisum TaxID=7029 RepID=A0A8R2A6A0_ACYPI|nr:coiled-coil domain-containing protein 149 [Acyrthosiphon pisum]XP_016663820.1 coiled-coil domain-containing protein 149 [Acyrthosiphon pisum]|eukprot:XP_001946800.1 PREDICTED: coiled-coil domain-containing protein 149 [Acyrthosiphon pisum]
MDSTALERKLNSKTAALTVLSEELEKCRIERDHLKIILENKMLHNTYNRNYQLNYDKLVNQLREENKILRLEAEDVRQKLQDAQGDNQVLRTGGFVKDCINTILTSSDSKEELVKNLEIIHSKYQQLKLDFGLLLDDKQELITERDGFRNKIRRLNYQLAASLNANKNQCVLDIDSLLLENKYLNERLQLEIAEKEMIRKTNSLYQSTSKTNEDSSLMSASNALTRKVIACKQMQQILETGNLQALFSNSTTLADLRKLCQTLFEALQDKTIALNHQKKTNKILAKRLEDLEKKIKTINQGEAIMSPSLVLLNECSNTSDETDFDTSSIDESNTCLISKEDDSIIKNIDFDKYPNEMNTLPKNLQQLVTEAMQTITFDSSTPTSAKARLSSTSD